MKLYQHQIDGLQKAQDLNHVAFYWDMGTGKTFAGSEKMHQLGARVNLVVCQKSKIDDWYEHYAEHYGADYLIFDLTNEGHMKAFLHDAFEDPWTEIVGIINYDLIWRRPELLQLKDFTLLLDESSLIQNETAKRSRFILKMHPANVVLLSGTPTGGKYERLWSQMHLLGWNISKQMYWNQFVKVDYLDMMNRSIPIVIGYKNVDRLKRKMAQYGCQFLKTDEVFDLPEQNYQVVKVQASKEYKQFKKHRVVTVGETELVGDTTLTKMLYERQLCGIYSADKLKAFTDLVESTDDRLIVFYNFTEELKAMKAIVEGLKRKISTVNGSSYDLFWYGEKSDSVTFVQYQAGSMGLNLQLANKIIYYTPPLSCELWMQSLKRIHRIGQHRPCFYYQLVCKGSVEERIYAALQRGVDYTDKLFEKDDVN